MNAVPRSDEDAVLPVSLGTVAWLVVLVVLLARKSELDADGSGWWIAVAAVGLVTGIGGVLFTRRRRSRMTRVRRLDQE
ncbi:MAG: DUF2530 domain-containing protein [bacterium]|nr:DUF2530 domain-containing protein [bacterium]